MKTLHTRAGTKNCHYDNRLYVGAIINPIQHGQIWKISMNHNIQEYIEELDLSEGASENLIKNVESQLSFTLPNEYKSFMIFSNGAEGSIGKNSYVALWSLDEIVELNKAYSVNEFAHGLVLFGSDGGNTAYAFDKRTPEISVVEIPFIIMDLDDVEKCGKTFDDFLYYLYTAE
jgi:hypothetical protein